MANEGTKAKKEALNSIQEKYESRESKMITKISNIDRQQSIFYMKPGFTLTELLVGSVILLAMVLASLGLYVESNKTSVDQMQFTELQHDVRSAMFFIQRYIRSAGVGLLPEIAGYFIEGTDGFSPSPEKADSIKILGNFDEPMSLKIKSYMGGGGGGAATAFLYDWDFENNPYASSEFYEDRVVLLISTKCPGCFAYRYIPQNAVFGFDGTGAAKINFQPGLSDLNPPGGLIDTGCASGCWEDAKVTFGQIKQYWVDTTGNPGDYPSLNLVVGQSGYLGIPNTFYATTTNENGSLVHMALALNIENLQFQYFGDLNNDGISDGFTDWENINWTISSSDDAATKQSKLDLVSRIRLVRIWILGKTKEAFVGVSGQLTSNNHLYRRPSIANSSQSAQVDYHRRFLLETTANIRNLSLDRYNNRGD